MQLCILWGSLRLGSKCLCIHRLRFVQPYLLQLRGLLRNGLAIHNMRVQFLYLLIKLSHIWVRCRKTTATTHHNYVVRLAVIGLFEWTRVWLVIVRILYLNLIVGFGLREVLFSIWFLYRPVLIIYAIGEHALLLSVDLFSTIIFHHVFFLIV